MLNAMVKDMYDIPILGLRSYTHAKEPQTKAQREILVITQVQ